jgi:methyl-accepting chemotaxis protein
MSNMPFASGAVKAVGQIRSLVQNMAKLISGGREMTLRATQQADERLKTVQRLQAAMAAIRESNELLNDLRTSFQAIQSKTRVINDIVFKTKLLSFNASIEAARAGQYGKGFSVVAEEVGRLAQTSGQAAKEIDALLSDSQNKAEAVVKMVSARANEGVNVARAVQDSFLQSAQAVSEIARVLAQIEDASNEQTLVIEQAASALSFMKSSPAPFASGGPASNVENYPESDLEGIDADHPSFLPQR